MLLKVDSKLTAHNLNSTMPTTRINFCVLNLFLITVAIWILNYDNSLHDCLTMEWPLLNSLTSVNLSQIEKQDGYQGHSIFDNKYISRSCGKKVIFCRVYISFSYLLRIINSNKYPPSGSNGNVLYITTLVMQVYLLPDR